MVTTSGFPKAGNHALVKAVQLLGQPCHVEHLTFGSAVKDKHIFIKRDPRNIIVSWLRFNGQPVTPGMFLTAFRRFQSASLVEEMGEYEGWLADTDTLVVRYEDLVASDAEMRRVAEYMGVPYLDGSFEALPGLTRTWTGPNRSDYKEIWTPEVESSWCAEGGPDLMTRWGY